MIQIININKSQFCSLPFLKDTIYKDIVGKGWSWSYVYNFIEIRNIFIALRQWKCQNFNLVNFYTYCKAINLPFVKTEWTRRRILEHINALKNFEIIDSNGQIIRHLFINSQISSPLSKEDLNTFRKIYFQYFRFKEIFSWFIDQPQEKIDIESVYSLNERTIIEKSHPIFYFSNESRFIDSFILELNDNPVIFNIERDNADLMRFWDVFIKWGITLGILEKFSLSSLNIKTIFGKNINCIYIINNNNKKFDFNLVSFINQNYNDNYIYIPQLIFDLVFKFRLSIKIIQDLIIEQYKIHKEFISFERTSEIFIKKQEIKDGDKILFPKYKDSYVSHLIIRK